MDFKTRYESFEYLGRLLRSFTSEENSINVPLLQQAIRKATLTNPWFTEQNIMFALKAIGESLTPENLERWLTPYKSRLSDAIQQKTIAVIMAGNIPAVGFHDFLCVLLSGHMLKARLSSSDPHLIPALAELLSEKNNSWKELICFTPSRIDTFDAVIATGSDNTARYFDYYFGQYPNIIRRNRNSVAILTGNESNDELEKIADDCMLYFGLGCRSVSKLYVPDLYDLKGLIEGLARYRSYSDHAKYYNNYSYNHSIYLMNSVPFIDTGFMVLRHDPQLTARIAELHYEYYTSKESVVQLVTSDLHKIQCVVSMESLPFKTVKPGKTQHPELWDYADDSDTIQFLLTL